MEGYRIGRMGYWQGIQPVGRRPLHRALLRLHTATNHRQRVVCGRYAGSRHGAGPRHDEGIARRAQAALERNEPYRQASAVLHLLSRIRRLQLRPRRANDLCAPAIANVRIAIASRISFCLTLTCMLSVWQPCALALDPALDVSQYGHTAWKIRDGFSKSEINVFAQTPDGYLWLGTYFGLLRFDGVRNIPWQAPAGMSLPDDRIRALLAAHDGTLWIGTVRGLASWNGSKLVTYPRFDGTLINALAEDREGTVWVGARTQSVGLLCAIRGASTECYGEDGSLGASINSLYEDSEGALWVAGGNRLWRWKPGSPIPYWLPGPVSSLNAVSETASGEILIVTVEGIRQLVDGKVETFPLPPVPWPLRPNKLFRDRDGAFWIAVRDSGLIHAHQGRIDVFARSDGLSGDLVDTVFEDREGNVWVATLDGVDRFRVLAASTYSM